MTLSSHNLTRSLSRGALALSGAICLSWACSATHPSDSTVRQRARPLSASTLVSGELDVAPYVASLIESANGLDVAKGVDSHLVVWSNSHSYNTHAYEVYGARVALSGTLLDPVAFVVSQSGQVLEPNGIPIAASSKTI